MAERNFLGFKQVTLATYNSLTEDAKKGYIWLVRELSGETAVSSSIYAGTRLYATTNEDSDEKISNLINSLGNVVDANGEWLGFVPSDEHAILGDSNDLTEALEALETYILNHHEREILTVCTSAGTPMYDADIAQAVGNDYQITLKKENGDYYDNLRDVIAASKEHDTVLSLKKREYTITDIYESDSTDGFAAVTLVSVNGGTASGHTVQPDILYGVIYQSKVAGEAPDTEHIFMRVDSLISDIESALPAFLAPYLTQIQTAINTAVTAEMNRAMGAEKEVKDYAESGFTAVAEDIEGLGDRIDVLEEKAPGQYIPEGETPEEQKANFEAQATSGNVGSTIILTKDIADAESGKTAYTKGAYVVDLDENGNPVLKKLGTTSASGDIQEQVDRIDAKVGQEELVNPYELSSNTVSSQINNINSVLTIDGDDVEE